MPARGRGACVRRAENPPVADLQRIPGIAYVAAAWGLLQGISCSIAASSGRCSSRVRTIEDAPIPDRNRMPSIRRGHASTFNPLHSCPGARAARRINRLRHTSVVSPWRLSLRGRLLTGVTGLGVLQPLLMACYRELIQLIGKLVDAVGVFIIVDRQGLGLIVVIRTFLSMTLQLEVDGRWPWQRGEESGKPPS